MADSVLSIGEVARRAGVNVSTVRYYERKGLLPAAERSGGQRRFGEDTVRRLEIVAAAKRAGFSLDEIRTLLSSTDRGTPLAPQLQTLAARKLPELEALIERAQGMRQWLTAATHCDCESLESCALFAK